MSISLVYIRTLICCVMLYFRSHIELKAISDKVSDSIGTILTEGKDLTSIHCYHIDNSIH